MEILAIINQKGGVGKSTTSRSVGAGLAIKGYKVLYIDLDAQGNLTHTIGATTATYNILDVLQKTVGAEKAIIHTPQIDFIAAVPTLAGADTLITAVGKEYRLKEALEPVVNKKRYDYIIVDTPPALGILTINALTACRGVIIPSQADIYSVHGISQLYTTIDTVKKYCNPSLKIKGIVLTRYNGKTILGREVAELINRTAKHFKTKLYKTPIRECIAIKESQAQQQDIFSYAPKSNAAQDYKKLVDEIEKR